MSDAVEVPYGESARDTAVLLLAAVEELELDPSVITTSPEDGVFYVPAEVAKKAKASDAEEKPAKKAVAKKTTSK